MLSDLANFNTYQSHTYRLQLHGALNSETIDWSGEIVVIPQEDGGILVVSLLVGPADLHNLLDQFKNLNLTLLPLQNEIQKSDPQNKELPDISPWITPGTSLPEQTQIDSKEASNG